MALILAKSVICNLKCHQNVIMRLLLQISVLQLHVLFTDVKPRTDEEVIEYWQSVLGPAYQIVVSICLWLT
jgi:hypothetical protein